MSDVTARLHVLFEHGTDLIPFGSSQIRLLRPLTHPKLSATFPMRSGLEYFGEPVDAVVIDRLWRPQINMAFAESIVNDIRRSGAKFVYAVDDNFLDLEMENLDWRPEEGTKRVFEYFMRHADAMLVTTEYLRDRLSKYASNIFVLPNALDERLLGPRPHDRADDERITIGYMGTRTHDEDLRMIFPVLRKILSAFGDKVRVQLLGGAAKDSTILEMAEMGVEVISPPPFVRLYEKFVPWFVENIHWDIGLSPLRDTPFARCKSDIKYLDYSAAGITGIYSQVPAYQHSVKHLRTGYLVDNTSASWQAAIEHLIQEPDLRTAIALAAEKDLLKNRTLDANVDRWKQTLDQVLG